MRRRGLLSMAVLVAAGVNELAAPSTPVAPTIGASAVEATSYNVLSIIVSIRVRNADRAAVRFHLADTPLRRSALATD